MGPAVQRLPSVRAWPGIDHELQSRLSAVVGTGGVPCVPESLEEEMRLVRGRPSLLGPPLRVHEEFGARIARLVKGYHRAVETIVREFPEHGLLRRILRLPGPLRADVEADVAPSNSRIHLCRLDLLLDAEGGFKVIETNANCPGGLLSCGIASRRWRAFLRDERLELPSPLAHESPNWMARWFLDVATAETAVAPGVVALLREKGGNRLELPGLAKQLRAEGVEAIEADPRDLGQGPGGIPLLHGRPVRHAYLKVGIRELARMRSDIEVFITAVREQKLFVQNGIRGRCVGDNKLCLAVLSDPRFEHLFDAEDVHVFRDHIPWSRSAAVIAEDELETIRADRGGYVLKRPLDTRGRGVVIGREVTADREWNAALFRAVREGWLVQEFCPSTQITADVGATGGNNHDLSVGAINGTLVGALSRSSAELRMNVARTGRLHPVFLAGA